MEALELYLNINEHLLNDRLPSQYFNQIFNEPTFKDYPFEMLHRLKDTKQSPKHHPEGDVWNHTMLVVDQAAGLKDKSKDQNVFMWGALLHDIGKPATTRMKKGRITAYDHDKAGEQLAVDFLSCFTEDKGFIGEVSKLVRWHMQILFVVNDLPFADVDAMKSQTDINEIALLGLCDRLGRTNVDLRAEEKNIQVFLEKCG